MRGILFILIMSPFSVLNAQQQPSDKYFWYSLETTAPPSAVWEIWMNVPNWKKWDTGL